MTKIDSKILKESEEFETAIYFRMAGELYGTCASQSEELFKVALQLTNHFSNVTADAMLQDSRIIKILRFCMLPVISQMKLGQLIGINTTSDFEEKQLDGKSKAFETLKAIAPKLSELFNKYMDSQRFIWLQTTLSNEQKDLAIKYSMNWTCSLIANQNTTTAFRNWRKELQESTGVEQLVKAGYTSVSVRKIITSIDDLLPGQFSKECRVKGVNVQKADFVVRLKKSKKLLLIEAKAIGVRIDAFKRIKECREKFTDWRQAFGINGCVVGALLSGFIPESEYSSLVENNIQIFWEHKNDLYDFVNEN